MLFILLFKYLGSIERLKKKPVCKENTLYNTYLPLECECLVRQEGRSAGHGRSTAPWLQAALLLAFVHVKQVIPENDWIMERKRSNGFCRIYTVAF